MIKMAHPLTFTFTFKQNHITNSDKQLMVLPEYRHPPSDSLINMF